MKKQLGFFLAASLVSGFSYGATPDEVRIAYSGGSQVIMLAKADGSLDKAFGTKVNWVQFASGADALNYFASNAIDIANFGSSPATAGLVRKLPIEIVGVSGVIASYERLIGKEGIRDLRDLKASASAIRLTPPRSMRWTRRLKYTTWTAAKSRCCRCVRQKWSPRGSAAILTRATSGRRSPSSWKRRAAIRCSPPKICRKMAT